MCAGDTWMLSAITRSLRAWRSIAYRYSLIVEDIPKSVDPLLTQVVLSRYESNLCY